MSQRKSKSTTMKRISAVDPGSGGIGVIGWAASLLYLAAGEGSIPAGRWMIASILLAFFWLAIAGALFLVTESAYGRHAPRKITGRLHRLAVLATLPFFAVVPAIAKTMYGVWPGRELLMYLFLVWLVLANLVVPVGFAVYWKTVDKT